MPAPASSDRGRLPSILFAVLTSRATRQRAAIAAGSWCSAAGASCRFYADEPLHGGDHEDAFKLRQWTAISTTPPRGCCKQPQQQQQQQQQRRHGSPGGFFCSAHRRATLPAQYRYLPALQLARRTAAVSSGRVQWVVLLDDDSFVFVRRLRSLLSRYDARRAVLLGEFKRDRAYACGGAGAVLSREALRRLDLDACIAHSRRRCMQSDWMLGECVRRAASSGKGGVLLEGRHGCGSCASANCTSACAGRLRSGCHFMQNASAHAPWVLGTAANCSAESPSIVHGLETGRLARRIGQCATDPGKARK